MSGQGGFNRHLHSIRRAAAPSCTHCRDRLEEADEALHTLLQCGAWIHEQEALESLLGTAFKVGFMVDLMLGSLEGWSLVQAFANFVLSHKESVECLRQRQPPVPVQADLRR